MNPNTFYSGFSVDYDQHLLELFTEKPDDHITLFTLWEEAFADFDNVNVLLSGGIDSQFSLSVLSTLGKTIHVYICSFVWEDVVFNGPDVIHAMRYCDRYNLRYTSIEIDYKQFLHTNKHLEFCKMYKATSPQIALQLAILDLIDSNEPFVLGGDLPLMQFDFNHDRSVVLGSGYQPFITRPFLNYALANNKIVIKDLFRLNPYTHYLGFKQFIETTKKHKLILTQNLNGNGASQELRRLIYTDIGCNLIPPLAKNTGFEQLKTHLAMHSGVYNQFDLLYRYPLEHTLKAYDWADITLFKVKHNKEVMDEMKKEYEEFCINTPDLKISEFYNFIL